MMLLYKTSHTFPSPHSAYLSTGSLHLDGSGIQDQDHILCTCDWGGVGVQLCDWYIILFRKHPSYRFVPISTEKKHLLLQGYVPSVNYTVYTCVCMQVSIMYVYLSVQ